MLQWDIGVIVIHRIASLLAVELLVGQKGAITFCMLLNVFSSHVFWPAWVFSFIACLRSHAQSFGAYRSPRLGLGFVAPGFLLWGLFPYLVTCAATVCSKLIAKPWIGRWQRFKADCARAFDQYNVLRLWALIGFQVRDVGLRGQEQIAPSIS